MKTYINLMAAGLLGLGILCLPGCEKQEPTVSVSNGAGEEQPIECDIEQQNASVDQEAASQELPQAVAKDYHVDTESGFDLAGVIGLGDDTRSQRISNFCIDGKDNLLVCDERGNCVRHVDSNDKLKSKWALDFSPQAVEMVGADRFVVAGPGQIALMDLAGATIASGEIPGKLTTSLGHTDKDIFVVLRDKTSFSVYRMDYSFDNQKQILDGLRGCCSQQDITCHDDFLYRAANCEFAVVKYDRDGNEVARFGKKGDELEGFSGCCEPKNVCFDNQGNLYASESALRRVKIFSTDGNLKRAFGNLTMKGGCVRVTIAINSAGDTLYMLDTASNVIRALKVLPQGGVIASANT